MESAFIVLKDDKKEQAKMQRESLKIIKYSGVSRTCSAGYLSRACQHVFKHFVFKSAA